MSHKIKILKKWYRHILSFFWFNCFFFAVLFLFFQNIYAEVITSTVSGGEWAESATWAGGVLPVDGDEIILQGSVILDEDINFPNTSLTITSGGILSLEKNIYVRSIKNEGVLQKDSGDRFVKTYEDFENRGLVDNVFWETIGALKNSGIMNLRYLTLHGDFMNAGNITIDHIQGGYFSLSGENKIIFQNTGDLTGVLDYSIHTFVEIPNNMELSASITFHTGGQLLIPEGVILMLKNYGKKLESSIKSFRSKTLHFVGKGQLHFVGLEQIRIVDNIRTSLEKVLISDGVTMTGASNGHFLVNGNLENRATIQGSGTCFIWCNDLKISVFGDFINASSGTLDNVSISVSNKVQNLGTIKSNVIQKRINGDSGVEMDADFLDEANTIQWPHKPPYIELLLSESYQEEGGNVVLKFKVDESTDVIEKKLYYYCSGGWFTPYTCEKEVNLVSDQGNIFYYTIPYEDIKDGRINFYAQTKDKFGARGIWRNIYKPYWLEIETLPIGAPPEAKSGKLKDRQPPEAIASLEAQRCGGDLYFRFPTPRDNQGVTNYRLWVGKTLEILKDTSARSPLPFFHSLDYLDPIEQTLWLNTQKNISGGPLGQESKNTHHENFKYIGITALDRADNQSSISPTIVVEDLSVCENSITLSVEKKEIKKTTAVSEYLLEWTFEGTLNEGSHQYYRSGSSLNIYLVDREKNEFFHNSVMAQNFQTDLSGIFQQFLPSKFAESPDTWERRIELRDSQGRMIGVSDWVSYPPKDKIRIFKTSIPEVILHPEPKGGATPEDILIPTVNTEVQVVGEAIVSSYVDTHKTDRWYKVLLEEEDGISHERYVIATAIRPAWIGYRKVKPDLDCSGLQTRPNDTRISKIVLHATAADSQTGRDVANSFYAEKHKKTGEDTACVGAHFFIGRDGSVEMGRPFHEMVYHAGFGGLTDVHPYMNVNGQSFRNSRESIGIEIANSGLIEDQISTQSDQIVAQLDTEVAKTWKVWSHSDNWSWGSFPTNLVGTEVASRLNLAIVEEKKQAKRWRSFTEDQYRNLDGLLQYLTEATGIPYRVWKYNATIDRDYELGYYFFPRGPNALKKDLQTVKNKNKQLRIIQRHFQNLNSFTGIISHHLTSAKWDVGPALNICHGNFNFINLTSHECD